MRAIVVGLGVQGQKRKRIAGAECVGTVDPVHPEADFRSAGDVPEDLYDAVLACIPDAPKVELIEYWLSRGKHVLVEKPLFAQESAQLARLEALARANGVTCYTAYNHRFEPHFVRMKELIDSGRLGKIYRCRMFYGNGTARLVRDSAWRDDGAGVLPDLGSHLLDTIAFWFGDYGSGYRVAAANCFENRAPDHVVLINEQSDPRIELEMTLLMWRNHFTCDILAERGSAHIESLCKWGPSSFTTRTRILPSGRPPEESVTLVQEDPTWAAEYAHFKRLCEGGGAASLVKDAWLNDELSRLSADALSMIGLRPGPRS
jgi:predicted dehydrogenase